MSALLTSLPGNIPGLLRRGSPVIWRDEDTPWVVCYVWRVCDDDPYGGENVLLAPCTTPCLGIEDSASNVALDLTDPTGRAHAAWWLNARRDQVTFLEQYMVDAARMGIDMTPKQIDTLARLVLRLAGRTP